MKVLVIFVCLLFLGNSLGLDHTIVAPKAFRIGVREKVVLNLHGYTRATVSAYLQNLPKRVDRATFSHINGIVLNGITAREPVELEIMVQEYDILKFGLQQKVFLVIEVANSNSDFTKELEILVSRESGYIFVVTNRPVYKPGDTVFIKVFLLGQSMQRLNQATVTITVKTPDVDGVEGIGVYKKQKILQANNHFIKDFYEIPHNSELGAWKVTAYSNGYETTSETSFDVKDYVLPTFQVTVNMNKPFVLARDESIRGSINAAYSYGEPIQGSLHISIKLKKSSDSVPTEIYKIPRGFFLTEKLTDGQFHFVVPLIDTFANILNKSENASTLVSNKASIIVEASVNDAASGELESTISPEIPIVSSPYRITSDRTSAYYAPELTYQLRIDLKQSYGEDPASDVPVQINVDGDDADRFVMTNDRGQIDLGISFVGNMTQTLHVKTVSCNLLDAEQATTDIQVLPYTSPNSRYLQVSSENKVYQVNSKIQLTFYFNELSLGEIRYYVLARGSIVLVGVNRPSRESTKSTETVLVTEKMVPSARVVAYYLKNDEVVSDSFWFDVQDRCNTSLAIRVPEVASPGECLMVEIRGSGNALVSVSVVDKSVSFLNNQIGLTSEYFFNKMESYDQGCVKNGGSDGPGVFLNAGLTLSSKSNPQRVVETLDCDDDVRRRKKRQAGEPQGDEPHAGEPQEEMSTMFSEVYTRRKLKECKLNGQYPRMSLDDTCENRMERAAENFDAFVPNCSVAFFTECKKTESQRDNEGRGFFPQKTLHSSITTIEIDAVSMGDSGEGFCVAETVSVRMFKDVFIQLHTPYSLKKFELANLRISVFNYNKYESYQVEVQVLPEDDSVLCTRFTPGRWETLVNLDLKSDSVKSSILTVIPLKIPKDGWSAISLRVKDKQHILDEIRKKIILVESGEVKSTYRSYAIDLKNSRRQTFDIQFNFPENVIQQTRKCTLYAHANLLGFMEVEPIQLKPNRIENIFRKAYGNGETVMLTSGPNVYAHMYLDFVGTLKEGSAAYDESISRIESGYSRELQFRSDEVQKKAFAVYERYPPSTWLNAFVGKVFTKAKQYATDLDIGPICSSLEWLLTQQVNGTYFDQKRPPFHREMHGSVGRGLTLTAYVVISLLETQSQCATALNLQIQTAATNAVEYLTVNKNDLTFQMRPYGLALLSYALALHDPTTSDAREIFERLLNQAVVEENNIHWVARSASDIEGTDLHAYWYSRRPQAVSVEATAYALLAQIAMTRVQNPIKQASVDRARKTALWLIVQRNEGGAFVSTQDTVIGLQALTTYEMWLAEIDSVPVPTDFTLHFTAPGTVWSNPGHQMGLNDNNVGNRQELKIPNDVVSKTRWVSVTAAGIGEGVLSYKCTYHIMKDEDACQFHIAHNVTIISKNEAHLANKPLAIKINLEISKPRGLPTAMTIVEVGLLSGFLPVRSSIARWTISEAVDGLIHHYDITNVNIVLYLRKIDANVSVINFEMQQAIHVNRPEPAKINIYDPHDPSVRCGKFYALPQHSPDIRTTNCHKRQINNEKEIDSEDEEDVNQQEAAVCKCAEGSCLKCRTRRNQLDQTACLEERGGSTCEICDVDKECDDMFEKACNSNYVYLVNITRVSTLLDEDMFYKFVGDVFQIIKLGDKDGVVNSSSVEFMVKRDCYEACEDESLDVDRPAGSVAPVYTLIPNRLIVVMGNQPESFFDRSGNIKYQYWLDHDSMVEPLIPQHECNVAKSNYFNQTLGCAHEPARRSGSQNEEQQVDCFALKKLMVACDNFEAMMQQIRKDCV